MLKRSLRLKRSPLKRKKKEVNREEIERMNTFFLSIWAKRPRYCTICGAWLGKEPRSYMFDHILEKERYPELKYEEENIALLCFSCHDLKTRKFIPESYGKLIEKTKKLFGIHD